MFKGLFKNTRQKGGHYEKRAENYLNKHNLVTIERNYSCRHGEIDIIMRDGDIWVFVEVKYRQSSQFGGAIHALTSSKQKRIRKTIYHYLAQQQLHNVPIRVDFIAIEGVNPDNITWIKSVF